MGYEYRNPDEDQLAAAQTARINTVLDQAVRDGASCLVAIELGEPQDVVELWTDRIWNGLRDNLADRRGYATEDRLAAIVLLLAQRMNDEADAILRPIAGEVDRG